MLLTNAPYTAGKKEAKTKSMNKNTAIQLHMFEQTQVCNIQTTENAP